MNITSRIVLGVGLAVLCSAVESAAEDLPMAPIQDDTGSSPQILHGEPAHRADWPVTLPFTSDDGSHCTGTIVGDQALVTAAHCVADGQKGRVLLNNQYTSVICKRHPLYDDRPKNGGLPCHLMIDAADIASCTADVALCQTDPPGQSFPTVTGKFERIKSSPPGPVAAQHVTILGYGCIVANGLISNILNVGTPKVLETSIPGASTNPQNSYKEFIETEGAALCSGDSGGAAYSSKLSSSREIVGIGSRGNISSISYFVNVLDPRIAAFFHEFSAQQHVKLCGVDPTAENCVH